MPQFESVFHEIAVLLLLCAVIGLVANRLRQPLLVGFIAAGILVGPSGVGLLTEMEQIELLAQIGIALLLFVVGLKLDLRLVRVVGPVALATGLGQVLFTSAIGYAIALALGMTPVTALYVAIALTFSSTIIIVKLLSDKRELDDLHGRIAIGFLIVQDIVVVLAMITITAFGEGEGDLPAQFAGTVLRGALFLGGIYVLMRWVLPRLLHLFAHSGELLVLFGIAWAVALAAAAEALGFSEEVGAFLAGVSLASTDYRDALGARLTSLRDFLLLFFFITLGVQLDLEAFAGHLGAAVGLSLFVLVGNPLIVMVIMGLMRYRARVSFRAGLTVAQISEFSLILVALGFGLGHIGSEAVGLVTAVGLITIALSTYLIYNSAWLYDRLEPLLRLFERPDAGRSLPQPEPLPVDVAVLGLGRYGSRLVTVLKEAGWRPLGVDFDPQALRAWEAQGLPVAYADAHDAHIGELVPLASLRWFVSSTRDLDANRALIRNLRHQGFEGGIAVTALSAPDAEILEEAGADVVLRPFLDAARDALHALESGGRGARAAGGDEGEAAPDAPGEATRGAPGEHPAAGEYPQQ